ncbi:uncharacterized protein PGTG_12999 [Puccinia graminis f. sp. tritici CRL 75-36-700-3]|uniref:Uncharacterized protein n=1 Tax=Puccinia graminis f. sp. tritici (strain CRL 75-36-700-3 / race SCCL) TaxID=418459 RepID=E3KQP2_PUCGT|nr:uncharacterized protein PGTG_12999 [Puccinia graminis f. sp. tritici CRL 75-36-700-3]EFP86617.1 hypothetical protein PGTG_12999 [Puccinia graminis f. sp. tritici CRL 75-36-700-3]
MSLVNPEWYQTNTACVNCQKIVEWCVYMYYNGVRVWQVGPTRDPRSYEAGSGRSLGNVDLTRTDPACSQVGFGQVLQTSGQPRVDPKTRLGSRGPRVRTQGRVRIRDSYPPQC